MILRHFRVDIDPQTGRLVGQHTWWEYHKRDKKPGRETTGAYHAMTGSQYGLIVGNSWESMAAARKVALKFWRDTGGTLHKPLYPSQEEAEIAI